MFDPNVNWIGYWEKINESLGMQVESTDQMMPSIMEALVVMAEKIKDLEAQVESHERYIDLNSSYD